MVIVHGLYGSGDNWVSIAREFEDQFEVYVVDQRNHGQSPHSDTHDYPSLGNDLCRFLDNRGIDRAVMIGHSMGGKAIMQFAKGCPDRVASMIAVDIAPRAYHEMAAESRSAPNHAGMIDAMLELDLSKVESREDADRMLSTSIGSDRVRGFLLKNLRREKEGDFYWRINLPALRNNLEQIMDGLDLDQVRKEGGITGFPVLFVSAERSDYIRAGDHALIREIFPTAEIVRIPGAGHWVHAEKPTLLVKNFKYFLGI